MNECYGLVDSRVTREFGDVCMMNYLGTSGGRNIDSQLDGPFPGLGLAC